MLPITHVSHLYTRTLVLSISGWCSSTGAALSVRPSGHIGHGYFYQPANTVTWEGGAKVIPQPWSHSSWEVVMEGGTRSRCKQKQPLLQRCRAKETDLIRFDSWQLAGGDCPGAAEELYVVNVVGIQCLFLQVPRVQRQEHRRTGRGRPVGHHLLSRGPISEGIQPSGAPQRKR